MLRRFRTGLMAGSLAAVVIACSLTPVGALASTSSGNVAGWVAHATKIGLAPNLPVTIAVHLQLKNPASLKQLVAQVSSPKSKLYGGYLTSAEFGTRFAPDAADVASVKALLDRVGMTNVQVGPYGVYVSATATVEQLRTTFHISQDLYSYQGKTLRANPEEPTLPTAWVGKVVYIEGLDDSTLLRHPFHHSATMGDLVAPASAAHRSIFDSTASDSSSSSASASVTPPPVAANLPSPFCNGHFGEGQLQATLTTAADVYGATIPWLNCAYTPGQIREAYGLDNVAKSFDGTGVTVAIVDAYASPTILDDSNRYSANHKLKKLTLGKNFTQIIPQGIYGVSPSEACAPYGWWGEESLDVAAVHGSAPGANIVFVGSRDCGTSLDIALFNTLYNHVADIVTNSWGGGGEAIAPGSAAAYDQALMAGAAQGMTVLFSSGDDGDLSAPNGVASGAWPATSNYVTGVGGTSLFIDSDGVKTEYGWGSYRAYLADAKVNSKSLITTSGLETTSAFGYTFDAFTFYSGSGGGISLLEPQPAYQAGVVPSVLATSLNLASGYVEPLPTLQRVSPDVAMVADPYTGYLYGETYTIAGDKYADSGCTPISKTEEYCEGGIGGTSLSSPLMAGVVAVMNQKRIQSGEPMVGFANPLFYSLGSGGNGGNNLRAAAFNEIVAPSEPVSVLRGYANDPTRVRVVTINSVPFNISTAPYGIFACSLAICEGLNDVFNYVSSSSASAPPTPAGYNDVTGLGVPFVPKLLE